MARSTRRDVIGRGLLAVVAGIGVATVTGAPALAVTGVPTPGSSGVSLAGSTNSVDDAATVVPDRSWTCGMPEGIVPPAMGTLVFRASLQLTGIDKVGETQYGTRRVLDVKGGTLTGSRIKGTVLSGGQDLDLTLSSGTVEIEQRMVLRLDNGAVVQMRNCGVGPSGQQSVRLVGDFEVANSDSHAWLNTGKFVGTRTVDAAAGTVELAMYDVSKVTPPATRIEIKDPAGVPNQTWECATGSGTRGAAVFSETVTMGTTLSIGASKRGTRTIMPVLGGPTSGRIVGKVLPGGADFQLAGSPMKLDARYTVATNDGEYIMVHNCGPMGALVPTFEARVSGPYGFLTKGKYVSEATASGASTAKVTFYERR